MANTTVYGEEWVTVLQERLDRPTTWSEVLDVDYTNVRVINNPYLSTTPAVQTGTRGTAYIFQDFAETSEARTISTYRVLPIFIDRADLAQSTFSRQMYWAELQGQLIQEAIEVAYLGQHASWTDFGTLSIGGGGTETTQITVSASNIDDIIRALKRRIRVANGQAMASRNGMAIIWRPADFEYLEAFVQANGFVTADDALKQGTETGLRYMGVDHYFSNDHTANHLFAGVKKAGSFGILRDTWGQIVITQDPNLQSGVGVISRADYGFAWWNNNDALYYDINVA